MQWLTPLLIRILLIAYIVKPDESACLLRPDRYL